MTTLKKILLLIGLLSVPLPSLADSIFDLSGTIQGNGVSSPVSFSGTVTVSYGGPLQFSITNWNISIPSIQGPGGSTTALVFTPGNSTVQMGFQIDDNGSHWYVSFDNGQSSLALVFGAPPDPNQTNYTYGTYDFPENGVYYIAQTDATLVSPVPEPSSAILLASGLAGFAAFRRKLFTRRMPAIRLQ